MDTEELQLKYNRLFKLVSAMRAKQIAWYTHHVRSDLDYAKRYEREVDSFLKSELKKKESKQQELF